MKYLSALAALLVVALGAAAVVLGEAVFAVQVIGVVVVLGSLAIFVLGRERVSEVVVPVPADPM